MANPWSEIPPQVMMRLDLGISRIQFLAAYWKRRRIGPVNLSSPACRRRERIAGSLTAGMRSSEG
jgi:hypothetical protein